MDYATLARKMLEAGGKQARAYIKAQLKKDAANRYSLMAEWVLPSLRNKYGLRQGSYTGQHINVLCDGKSILVWLNPFVSTAENNICDGATYFPDLIFGINLIPGSIAHDVWYIELEKIAAAFGIDEAVARKIGDDLFKSVNLAENAGKIGAKTITSLTYWGVRIGGGIYHKRNMAMLLLALSVALAGCAGCVNTDFENPTEYQSPTYEKGE